MDIKITGKELKATEAIKEYAAKKLERIEKYFADEDINVVVTIKSEKNAQIAEMNVSARGNVYRAATENKDLYASIDKDIDILEGQIRKMKTLRDKQTKDGSIRLMDASNEPKEIENEIVKESYYSAKPISIEDAKLKLQERATNQFLTFINVDTSKVNVIYKLKDGKNYGIVEPEA